jgi:glycosyltransferase involved in cell wall biosynthesis
MSNPQKRVLYVITKSVWGGAQRYVFDLATHLPRDQFNVAVATGGAGQLTERLAEKHIQVFSITNFQKSINPFKDIVSFFELLSIYKKFKPDIIHTNSSKAGGIAGLAALLYQVISQKHVTRIFTVHGWAFLESWRPTWQQFIIRVASTLTVLLHTIVIVISERDRKAVSTYNVCPETKVTLIHNGVNEIPFLPRADAQQELFGMEHSLVIGTIAEWTKNKGLTHLITAMPQVRKKFPDIKLCLIGWGEMISDFRFQIANLKMENSIILLSKSPAAPYLKAFDIFILPSLKEGLPYTLLEAGLAGIPVIASDVGGVPDIIEDKKNGLLVTPASSKELADAIIMLCENTRLREEMGKRNKERITTNFSLSEMIQKTITVYESLLPPA